MQKRIMEVTTGRAKLEKHFANHDDMKYQMRILQETSACVAKGNKAAVSMD